MWTFRTIKKTKDIFMVLVTLLNVILNTYQDNSRSNAWKTLIANIRTFLKESQKVLLSFMKLHLLQTLEPN